MSNRHRTRDVTPSAGAAATRVTRRRFLGLAVGAGAAVGLLGFPAIVRASPKTRACIVLGIDGMDPGLLARLLREGRLPNCRRLMETGCFLPLGTSTPPQSPVAWSSFTAGTGPGGHGIYDFIARDPATMTPRFAAARVAPPARSLHLGRLAIPLGGPQVENLRRGPVLWNELERADFPCTVLRMPANFPPTPTRARTLSGMGTPDLQGSYGTFAFYTDAPGAQPRDVPGGRIERIAFREHRAACLLPGPSDALAAPGTPTAIPFEVRADPVNPVARILVQGHELLLNEGEWSDWVPLRFPGPAPLLRVPGMCRFFLKRVRADFELYASPVNIDPLDPALPIATPAGYARELAGAVGRFSTLGLPEDTKALSAGVFGDDDYRRQALLVLEEQRRLFEHALDRFDGGLLFFHFSTLDLSSHVFWRAMDPGHPLYTAGLAAQHGDFLPWLYGRMDAVLGRAMERLDERTWLLAVSDHGFAPFRRQFNLNGWLLENGYAVARPGVPREELTLFRGLDWGGTRAYGLGINALYLNLRGREADGVVDRGPDAERLEEELVQRLEAVRDPQGGAQVISRVYRARDAFFGPFVPQAPDLIVGYAPGYRASWDTVLGGCTRELVLDNRDPWSGDHAMDPARVPGVLLSNRPVGADAPALDDLAPTILAAFGVPRAAGMTGRCLA